MCDSATTASKLFTVERFPTGTQRALWQIEGLGVGTGTIRCTRGKQTILQRVEIFAPRPLREIGHAFRCLGPPTPHALVRHGMSVEPLDMVAALAQLPPQLVELLTVGVWLTHSYGGPRPSSLEIVKELEATITAWPWNTEHLTIDTLQTGSEVVVFGEAASEAEVARFDALRLRYGSRVGFDIRLFDATPCEVTDAGAR